MQTDVWQLIFSDQPWIAISWKINIPQLCETKKINETFMWKKYQVRLLKPLVRTALFVAKEEIVDRKLPPPTLVITFTQSRS